MAVIRLNEAVWPPSARSVRTKRKSQLPSDSHDDGIGISGQFNQQQKDREVRRMLTGSVKKRGISLCKANYEHGSGRPCLDLETVRFVAGRSDRSRLSQCL